MKIILSYFYFMIHMIMICHAMIQYINNNVKHDTYI
jgi:hypothetical protein